MIYDEDEHSALAPGVVVLAVAVRPGTPEASKLLLDAQRAEASAVVFKRGTDPSGLSRVEASAGVAVLSVPEEMTWTQLHGFLLNARGSDAGRGGGGSPACRSGIYVEEFDEPSTTTGRTPECPSARTWARRTSIARTSHSFRGSPTPTACVRSSECWSWCAWSGVRCTSASAPKPVVTP